MLPSVNQVVRISVVIPTIDRGRAIVETVESVCGNTYPDYEVIVGDQSTDDLTRESLEPYVADGRVRYFRHVRRGAAINRNLGAWRAGGQIIAYVDDDCVVPQNWLESIAQVFDSNRRIGMVFGNVLAGPHDQRFGFIQAYRRVQPFTATRASQKHLVEGIGACMAIRKGVWETVGGFDHALGAGAEFRSAEDTDLALRVLLAGHHVRETPDVWVAHHGFRTWQQRPAMLQNYLYGLGAMCGKHLRSGHRHVGRLMIAYAFRWAFGGPVVEIGPRPPRLLRLKAFLAGTARGVLTRCDRVPGVARSFAEYLETNGSE